MNDKNSSKKIDNMIEQGFLKTSLAHSKIESKDKVLLNRKANILFNSGHYEKAARIYQTTGYSDGLSRIADIYLGKEDRISALKYFILAKREDRYQELLSDAVSIIQNYLNEDTK